VTGLLFRGKIREYTTERCFRGQSAAFPSRLRHHHNIQVASDGASALAVCSGSINGAQIFDDTDDSRSWGEPTEFSTMDGCIKGFDGISLSNQMKPTDRTLEVFLFRYAGLRESARHAVPCGDVLKKTAHGDLLVKSLFCKD
jgi:hypothetical protein